jgi:tetratricopeptide (TPR) repeat protein
VVTDATRQLLTPASTSPDAPDRDAPDQRDLVVAWATVLRACAAGRPVCWLTEDLHWAGADEIAFIEGLTADADWQRLLVVATGRPSVTGRVDADWDRLDLAPLAGGDARDLIEALVGDALPPDLVDRILDRSDGNPLFIEELLRTWVSVGTLERSGPGGRWRLATPATDIPLPTTIQAIYASQLDDLSGEARATARRAAVAGRRFPIEVLPELGAVDPDLAVAELTRRAVVSGPQTDDLLGDTYGYRHALVRDAGYASLARAERADLHVRLARWLEGAAGGDADLIAAAIGGHYADARANASALTSTVGAGLDRDEVATLAATWLERAGEAAIATAAYGAAREYLGRAVELTPDDDLLARGRRLTRLGQSFSGSGSLDQAIDADERAVACFEVALADGTMDDAARDVARRALATAARALGMARYEQTRFGDAADIAARALALVGDDDRATVPVELLAIEAELALTNDARSLSTRMADVRRRAEATGDPDLALEAAHTETRVRTEAGEATADEFLDLAARFEARGRWRGATSAMVNAVKAGGTDESFEVNAARADALADAHGLTESSVWIAMLRALRGLESGDWAHATEHALAGIGLGEANGYHRAVVRSWFVLGPMAAARGDRATLERAATWFTARGRDDTFPDSPYGRLMHEGITIDLAGVGLRDGPRPAIDRFEAAFGLPYDSADWLAAIERVVGAMLEAGLVDDARAALDLVPPPAPGRDPLTAASDALTHAWVAEADGDRETAVALARAGLSPGAAATAPWWTYRLLRVLDRGGAATSAEVDRAHEVAERLGLDGRAGWPDSERPRSPRISEA